MAAAWLAVVAAVVTAAPDQLDDDDFHLPQYDDDRINISENGMYLGSPCEFTCNSRLVHVFCDPDTSTCQCDPKHPVELGISSGCGKPKKLGQQCFYRQTFCAFDSHASCVQVNHNAYSKKLGEQCFYRQTCRAFDSHASCVQVNHNAYCQCEPGYHTTSHSRPTQRVFCTEDMVLLTADMPTLLGVASGIFVLAGLLCMVLHLYTRARYRPPRLDPPHLYSLNDTGGTVSVTRASSRASSRSAGSEWRGAGAGAGARRAGAARAAAILLFSRAHAPAKGSRRPSISSVQSSSSSIRSYSSKRWEKERDEKERRQMSVRLAQLHEKMGAGRDIQKPTPSPRSPNNSTDGLLPSVCEIRELMANPELPQGVDGPCSSSSLY